MSGKHHVNGRLPIRAKVRLLALVGILAAMGIAGFTFWTARHAGQDLEIHYRETVALLAHTRLIETFLVEVVGYSRDGVHDEAERLEHVASETLVAAISRRLGEPVRDPHGSPIPALAAVQDTLPPRPDRRRSIPE